MIYFFCITCTACGGIKSDLSTEQDHNITTECTLERSKKKESTSEGIVLWYNNTNRIILKHKRLESVSLCKPILDYFKFTYDGDEGSVLECSRKFTELIRKYDSKDIENGSDLENLKKDTYNMISIDVCQGDNYPSNSKCKENELTIIHEKLTGNDKISPCRNVDNAASEKLSRTREVVSVSEKSDKECLHLLDKNSSFIDRLERVNKKQIQIYKDKNRIWQYLKLSLCEDAPGKLCISEGKSHVMTKAKKNMMFPTFINKKRLFITVPTEKILEKIKKPETKIVLRCLNRNIGAMLKRAVVSKKLFAKNAICRTANKYTIMLQERSFFIRQRKRSLLQVKDEIKYFRNLVSQCLGRTNTDIDVKIDDNIISINVNDIIVKRKIIRSVPKNISTWRKSKMSTAFIESLFSKLYNKSIYICGRSHKRNKRIDLLFCIPSDKSKEKLIDSCLPKTK